MLPPERHLQGAATRSLSHGQWVMAEGRGEKSRQIQRCHGVWSFQRLTVSSLVRSCSFFLGTATRTGGHFAPLSETLVISDYFRAEVSFRSLLPRRLSSASAQQSVASSAMIHTWRIELSEADRMCNLHEWVRLTWSVSVKNERISGFMTDRLSENMAGLPATQKLCFPP